MRPLGAAFGTDLTGAVSARLNFAGPLEHLRISGDIDGAELTAAGAKLDRLRLAARIADLSEPKASVDGTFRAYGLDGKLALAAQREGNSELVLPHFRLAAADSTIDGSLRIALDTGLMRGSVAGRSADLAAFSKLAGTPLGGSVDFGVGLDAPGGQLVDISASGTKLTAGSGSSRIAAGRLAVTARFADILRAPSGSARVSLSTANFGASEIATATLSLDAPRPGRFVFQGDAKGQPLTVALAGDGALEPGRADLRLNRLAGSLGGERLVLEQPLTLSKHGGDLAFSGLALDYGAGRITGSGGVRGNSVSLALNAASLPIGSAGRLAGYRNVRGTLNAAATLGGTLRAPQGRMSLNARELTVASSRHSRLKGLGLAVDGSWNGRNLDVQGQVTGLEGDRVALTGAVPLLLTAAPLGISVPSDGRLALRVQGAGQIEHLADLLPLGEDRVSGHFAADAAVGGTVASPAASGRLRLSDGHYENFATGAILSNMQADLVGDRDRFTLTSFSAADSASGSLKAQGNVVLSGPTGPTAQLSATLANFRVAARDEAVATASGSVTIAGPVTAAKVTAPLTIDRADISLPESLPPNVVVLKVVEKNGKGGKPPLPAPADAQPALPATLDITIDMPGNIFVRGHGLESEWRGRLTITGTSAAPVDRRLSGADPRQRRPARENLHLDPRRDHLRRQPKARPGTRHRCRGERCRYHGTGQHWGFCLSANDHTVFDAPCAAGRDPGARLVQPRGRPDYGRRRAAARRGGRHARRRRARCPRPIARRPRARLVQARLGPERAGEQHSQPAGVWLCHRRHGAQRREIRRAGRFRRRQPGALAADQQSHGGNRAAPASDGARRGRPIRQHRHRPQLQLRLLNQSLFGDRPLPSGAEDRKLFSMRN